MSKIGFRFREIQLSVWPSADMTAHEDETLWLRDGLFWVSYKKSNLHERRLTGVRIVNKSQALRSLSST